MERSYPFERLPVYGLGLEFVPVSDAIASSLPASQEYLAGQLWELALAIPVQIARGTGQNSAADRAEVFALARGSAAKCAAILDVIDVIGLGDADRITLGRSLLERIVTGLDRLDVNAVPADLRAWDGGYSATESQAD